MHDIISLAQYEDIHTMGFTSIREVEELNKALTAGYDNPPGTGGGALRVESLEASLKVLTHQAKHCAFWQKVPKLPAFSTVEEYNQMTAVGDESGAFLPEGSLPDTVDSSYNRATSLVKFLGTTRSISHPMTLVKSNIGDVMAQENSNGILWILKNLEWGLFSGDADMCFLGSAGGPTHREGVEFNGLEKHIVAANIVDLKGAALTEGAFSYASQLVASNYGMPTDAFLSFAAHQAFCDTMLPKERVPMPSPAGGYSVGANIPDVNTPFGKINLNPDVFLNAGRVALAAATSVNAPTAPATIAAGAMAGADGVWGTHEGAGTYDYCCTAVNRFGESAPIALAAPVVVGAANLTNNIPFTITNAAAVGVVPEYFNIYKTKRGGTVRMLVGRVAAASILANGLTTFTDTGVWMAGTTKAFVGEMTPQVLAVKQLAPLMKMDLAVLAPAYRWMILCYLTFIVYAPRKWVQFINVGGSSMVM
jgi:hypothetical protein